MTEGERIRAIRKENDMTLERFGEKIGMKSSSISDLETGRRTMTAQTFKSICREFRINEVWLRTGEGDRYIETHEEDIVYNFIGDIMKNAPDFRRHLISVLARMTPEEWSLLEKKAWELVHEMQKAAPEGAASEENTTSQSG